MVSNRSRCLAKAVDATSDHQGQDQQQPKHQIRDELLPEPPLSTAGEALQQQSKDELLR